MAIRIKQHSYELHGKPRVYIDVTACLINRMVKYGVNLIPHWVYSARSAIQDKKSRQKLHFRLSVRSERHSYLYEGSVCPSVTALKPLGGYF